MPLSFLCLVSFTFLAVASLAKLIKNSCRYLKDVYQIALFFFSRTQNLPSYRPFCLFARATLGPQKIENHQLMIKTDIFTK